MNTSHTNKDLYLWSVIALAVALIASLIPASLSLSGTIGTNEDKGNEIAENIPADTFGFIGDIRVLSESELSSPNYSSFLSYKYYGQRDITVSEAVFKSVVDEYIKSDVKAVFICGGLSEMGSEKSLFVVQEQCKRLEESGKQVFVMNGTYDIDNTPYSFTAEGVQSEQGVGKERFAEIFADYGFNEAVSRDETTLSYACDIRGTNCRVISLSVDFFNYFPWTRYSNDPINPEVTDATLDWLDIQLNDARESGKEVIFMSYYPISEEVKVNMGVIAKAYSLHLINRDIVCSMLTQYGVKYTLCAQNSIPYKAEYVDAVNTDEEGNPLHFTLLATGTLCCYPAYYTTISYKNGTFSETSNMLQAIPEKYIPSYFSEEEKTKIGTNLTTYLQNKLYNIVNDKMMNLLHSNGEDYGMFLHYMSLIGIYNETWDEERKEKSLAYAKSLGDNIFLKLLHLPFYGKDIDSVESRLAQFDIVVPESDYIDFIDLLARSFFRVYRGEVALPEGSIERQMMLYSCYSLIDIMVDYKLFDSLRPFFPDLPELHWDNIHDRFMRTGICNLRYEDTVLQFWSIINLFLAYSGSGGINFKSSDEIIDLLNIIIRPALAIALLDDYNLQDDTVFGIDLTQFMDLERGIVNLEKFCDVLFFDIYLKELLF